VSSSYSLDEVPPQVQFFLFISAMSQFDWPITQKKKKLWRLLKTEGSILKHRVPFLWRLFGEHIRNLGTLCFEPPPKPNFFIKSLHGKSTGHIVQVKSEQWTVHSPHQTQLERKNPPPTPTYKNKRRPLHSRTQLLIGCMEILFLKLAATIFGLD
jgi:hypothetical protein